MSRSAFQVFQVFTFLWIVFAGSLVLELLYHRAWAKPHEDQFFINSEPAHCDYQGGIMSCETQNETCTYIGRVLKCEPKR